jgi:glycosyltransferase involved in cell wall biosynthesis
MMARKRILMIAPDLGYGGAEKSFSRWADAFAVEHDVTCVVFNDYSGGSNAYLSNFVSLDVPPGRNLVSKLWFSLLRIKRLRALKKKLNTDVSISFLEGADYVNVLSRQSEKIVLSIRGSKQYDANISGLVGWLRHNVLMPWLYNRADLITVVSGGIKQELRDFYKIKDSVPIEVIYNFYNPEVISGLAQQPVPPEWENFLASHEVMICVGRLARPKAYPFMIRVLKKMKSKKPDLKLLILGEGDLVHSLREQAESLGLKVFTKDESFTSDKDLYFAGLVQNPSAFLKRSKLFVLSSLVEGFPNALIEAMASHVPAAAADCLYGPAEIFDKPTGAITQPEFLPSGLLLPRVSELPDDFLEEQWANALMKALDDTTWRTRAVEVAAQQVEKFDYKRFKKSWPAILG